MAGDIIRFFLSGVILSGSLKKYAHQIVRINPTQPRKSEKIEIKRETQKNRIINLVGKDNYECIGPCFSDNWEEERQRLWEVIQEFKPDVIHFNEIPENFEYNGFPEGLLEKIYSEDRSYKILETCHDNAFTFDRKVHHPDAYVCVSDYHPRKIKEVLPDAKCYIWDYDIPKKERPDREETLLSLGLDPDKTHVLNVGLFHENKNQKFIYDIAQQITDENVQFHFIGNDCYLCNCGIENTDLPNCKVWGERDDVETFYSCMDIFFFPSSYAGPCEGRAAQSPGPADGGCLRSV